MKETMTIEYQNSEFVDGIELKGVWAGQDRYVWMPVHDFPANYSNRDSFWDVPCGCGHHGDHMGCAAYCRRNGCRHPFGVEVSILKLSEQGEEVEKVAGVPLFGERPKAKSLKSPEREKMIERAETWLLMRRQTAFKDLFEEMPLQQEATLLVSVLLGETDARG